MFGGNQINKLDLTKSTVMHNDKYHYSYNIDSESILDNTEKLSSYILFSLTTGLKITINSSEYILEDHEYIRVNNSQITNISGNIKCLISGHSKSNSNVTNVSKLDLSGTKTVSKPWGKEYWLAGDSGNFSFKHIRLNSGFKTSLQYHIEKEETNLILKGQANFHYKNTTDVVNDEVLKEHISSTQINENTFIHVTPNIIHRIKSLENLYLYETSTPQLDDVIRIQDDNNRADGKINSEHK